MPRPPAFVLWLATLASGVALGLALGSRATPLVAQTHPKPDASAHGQPAGRKGLDEDAIYRDLASTYERFQHVDRTFEAVAKAVSPSVVHITARKVGDRGNGEVGRFEETGSGVIVRPEGGKGLFVLTNNHVVDGAAAEDITILLHDGQVLKPLRFWADVKADVAVLKLDREGLPTAHLGDSDDARVGSWSWPSARRSASRTRSARGSSAPGAATSRSWRSTGSSTRSSCRPTPRSTQATRAARW